MSNRIAIYVRVSSDGQNDESQRREITRWLRGQGIDPDACRWFGDKQTGTNLDRPGFQQLQATVFNGEVDTIVCWKLDRLSRSLKDGINLLADWCERGMRVVSVTQQLDLSGAVGRLLAAVMLGLAEIENETRRERQAAGIAAAKERGVYAGRKRGSTKVKNLERVAELRELGLSADEIAKSLGVSRRSVYRYLCAAEPSTVSE